MKKLLICLFISLVFITGQGCSPSDVVDPEPVQSTPLTPKGKYLSDGGNLIRLTQENATLTSVEVPAIDGNIVSIAFADCTYSVDIAKYDIANANFWASQPMSVEYDPVLANCNYRCVPTGVQMVGTVAEATFSCTPLSTL